MNCIDTIWVILSQCCIYCTIQYFTIAVVGSVAILYSGTTPDYSVSGKMEKCDIVIDIILHNYFINFTVHSHVKIILSLYFCKTPEK